MVTVITSVGVQRNNSNNSEATRKTEFYRSPKKYWLLSVEKRFFLFHKKTLEDEKILIYKYREYLNWKTTIRNNFHD